MNIDWKSKKVLILGFSVSGKAVAEYLSDKDCSVFITEKRDEKPEDKTDIDNLQKLGVKIEFGGHSKEFLSDVDLAVTSPSLPLDSELYLTLKNNDVEIISEPDIAYLQSKTPFIAITGTNGKTTTTALVSHILSTEYNAPACGNIGKPPVSLIDDNPDYFVCEISSYQAIHSKYLTPKIACWTNFTPDHITWHGSVENYFDAKARLFNNPEFAILNGKDEKLVDRLYIPNGFTIGRLK